MHLNKYLIKDELSQIRDQFNKRKFIPEKFYSILLSNIHPFCNENEITCNILSIYCS